MAGARAVLTVAGFVAKLMPDLIATAHSLYRTFQGDVPRARNVLQIARDHGAHLDAKRLELDRELAQLRADRASRPPDA